MIHFFVNALAASAGGGLTYTRNVIPCLASHADVQVTVAISPKSRVDLRCNGKVNFLELDIPPIRRFWYEQHRLPEVILRSGANILLSAGNFALRKSPIPQILLSRNSIYTSTDFSRDLLSRGDYRMWLDTRVRAILAKKSVRWADITVAPSKAFALELQSWARRKIHVIYHGFDRETFTRDCTALPIEVRSKLDGLEGAFKVLFVSHYNYYRNFETLIRSLPFLRCAKRQVRLLLTCRLSTAKRTGAYSSHLAASLVQDLGVSDMIVELDTIPYSKLHHVYGLADVYVTPAYTETFGHPLVEAMSSGVPIVASDIAVHREICGDAAIYFDRFSPEALAHSIVRLTMGSDENKAMSEAGLEQVKKFSWNRHIEEILELSATIMARSSRSQSH